jgi:putative sterol carrier protein
VRGDAGKLDAPDLVLSTDVETWRKLNAGEIKAPTAVLKGKLKFHGSMYLALRIHFIIG